MLQGVAVPCAPPELGFGHLGRHRYHERQTAHNPAMTQLEDITRGASVKSIMPEGLLAMADVK